MKKFFFIVLGAALICILCFTGLSRVVNSHGIELSAQKPLELRKKPEKLFDLTPEILQAIHEIENTNFEINRKPLVYSTRFYRISAHTPRVLEGHYYLPGSNASFLRDNDNTRKYADFSSVAEFMHMNPKQNILVPLSAEKPRLFLENAYFYSPDSYVSDIEFACHGRAGCYPQSVYYSLDERKITGFRGKEIIRRTRIDKPPNVEIPPFPKTKY